MKNLKQKTNEKEFAQHLCENPLRYYNREKKICRLSQVRGRARGNYD
jgi:hypothetical protein